MRKIRERGITLIALVITIVVLLILAGITIGAITGDNGIINKTGQAKEDAEIANEKEIIDTSTVEAMGENKRGNLEEDEFQSAIDKHTDGKVEVTDIGEEFEVYFTETNRYYMVDKEGNIGEAQEVIKDKYPGDITKDENGNDLEGDESEPFEIWCIEDLVEWSKNYNNYINSYIILCRTLNFKSALSYNNSKSLEYGDINEDGVEETLIEEMQKGKGFIPIEKFSGTFDGKNKEIQNIYILNTGNVGLLRAINGATICNLGISGKIESEEMSSIQLGVGGIAGTSANTAKESIIKNCWNKALVKGNIEENYCGVGGILGEAASRTTILNCYNKGEIIATVGEILYKDNGAGAAGILGYVRGRNAIVNVYNSYNIGDITSNKTSAGIFGGIWAEGAINIENCLNIGKAKYGVSGRIYNANNTDGKNNFYLQESSDSDNLKSTVITQEQLKSQEIIDLLNNYINIGEEYKSEWKKWKLGENGYPTFE